MPATRDYGKEIEKLISDLVRLSGLIQNMSTTKEQAQMQGKKATFIIGKDIRYTFAVTAGGRVQLSDNLDNVTTYCACSSPKIFLEIVDKILDGDSSAFQRAYQRGDLKLRGEHSISDMLEWKKGLDRFVELKKQYSFV